METIIELRDVQIFQQETLVLSHVNLTVREGEFAYVVGKTGSGKSSLLKILYGDLHLSNGHGVVAGYDLKKLTWKHLPYLRRKLGIIFQDFQLLTDRSVESNLSFTLHATGWKDKKKMQERIHEVLDLVGLRTKGFKMPHELSGGEQQRVVIARALLNHPEIILADEPTGNLDPDTSDEILKLLLEITQRSKTAILFASHDFLTIQKWSSRTLKCENGRVIDSLQTAAEAV
ncbi:MAG: ATP-binding cassette domain-containing protein [Chitinophagales bacterium]|nr:ATP-binding cassette domain-containing protein [Chitinophagales bacterium]